MTRGEMETLMVNWHKLDSACDDLPKDIETHMAKGAIAKILKAGYMRG